MKSLENAPLVPWHTWYPAGHRWNRKRLWKRRKCSFLPRACHAGGRRFESGPPTSFHVDFKNGAHQQAGASCSSMEQLEIRRIFRPSYSWQVDGTMPGVLASQHVRRKLLTADAKRNLTHGQSHSPESRFVVAQKPSWPRHHNPAVRAHIPQEIQTTEEPSPDVSDRAQGVCQTFARTVRREHHGRRRT